MEHTFDYVHELLNRQMALRAKIEESPIAGDIKMITAKIFIKRK